jgi:hypothetical protein
MDLPNVLLNDSMWKLRIGHDQGHNFQTLAGINETMLTVAALVISKPNAPADMPRSRDRRPG